MKQTYLVIAVLLIAVVIGITAHYSGIINSLQKQPEVEVLDLSTQRKAEADAARSRMMELNEDSGYLSKLNSDYYDNTPFLPESEPAYTQTQADNWVTEIIPLVEEVTGRKFLYKPKVVVANRSTIAESLTKDIKAQAHIYGGNTKPFSESGIPHQQARALVAYLLGKYGFNDKTLYLTATNFKPILDLTNIDEALRPAIIKLIIAHELTHALQDQLNDISEIVSNVEGVDAAQAFSATIEGHAVVVQNLVGEKLKLDEASLQLARLLSGSTFDSDDPALQSIIDAIESVFEHTYMGGRDFMRYHFDIGGNELLWKIIANPPASTSIVLNPHTYEQDTDSNTSDLESLLDNMKDRFGDYNWAIQSRDADPTKLYSAYSAMDDNEKSRSIVNSIEQSQTILFTTIAPTRAVRITVRIHKNATDTNFYADTVEEMTRENLKLYDGNTTLSMSNLKTVDLENIEADIARKLSFVFNANGRLSDFLMFSIARDRVLVELKLVNLSLPEHEIIKIMLEILEHCEETIKLGKQHGALPQFYEYLAV